MSIVVMIVVVLYGVGVLAGEVMFVGAAVVLLADVELLEAPAPAEALEKPPVLGRPVSEIEAEVVVFGLIMLEGIVELP